MSGVAWVAGEGVCVELTRTASYKFYFVVVVRRLCVLGEKKKFGENSNCVLGRQFRAPMHEFIASALVARLFYLSAVSVIGESRPAPSQSASNWVCPGHRWTQTEGIGGVGGGGG